MHLNPLRQADKSQEAERTLTFQLAAYFLPHLQWQRLTQGLWSWMPTS